VSIYWALAVPVIIFVALVMPIWLTLHYRTQWARMRHVEVGDGEVAISKDELARLQRIAVKLDERIVSLEQVLGSEFPNWRKS
jgi:phage shock protein B